MVDKIIPSVSKLNLHIHTYKETCHIRFSYARHICLEHGISRVLFDRILFGNDV